MSVKTLTSEDYRSTADTFTSLLSHAEGLVNAGQVREARRFVAQFIERKHMDRRMLPTLAGLYLRVGKPEQAVGTMQRAIDELGTSADLLNTFGLLLASLGRERESRVQFEEALKLDSGNADALKNLAFALHRSGERSRAYALLVRCFYSTPLSAELRLVSGILLELDGRRQEAACCYRDAMELSGDCDQVRLASERLFRLGDEPCGLTFEEIIDRLKVECGEPEPTLW